MNVIDKVEELIHKLAEKDALKFLEELIQYDQNRGSRPGPIAQLKRFTHSYEYATLRHRRTFDLITPEEFRQQVKELQNKDE